MPNAEEKLIGFRVDDPDLSVGEVAQRLANGLADMGGESTFSGKVILALWVPVKAVEKVEEAASRAGLKLTRMDWP